MWELSEKPPESVGYYLTNDGYAALEEMHYDGERWLDKNDQERKPFWWWNEEGCFLNNNK